MRNPFDDDELERDRDARQWLGIFLLWAGAALVVAGLLGVAILDYVGG